ncbi:MAG: sigma-70 family RNA polymerase sigma factor [Bacteroidota bacterium]
MEEQSRIAQLKQGDQAAFRALVDQFQDRIYNTCLGFVYNAEDAEDLAQEVFMEVFRSIHKFKGEAKLSTWMHRIAVTKSLELIRSRNRKKRAGKVLSLFGLKATGQEPKAMAYDHPGVQLENKERSAVLFGAIQKLAENQRIAFTLHKVDAKSYQEVAEIMGVSLSSVESLMFRAKRNLRKKLEKYYREDQER